MWKPKQLAAGELPTVHLQPSDLMVAKHPTMLVTILGSCVAVCLYDRRRKVGAMCHGLLPKGKVNMSHQDCSRFVDCSIRKMVTGLAEKCGSLPEDLEAKVFGGARMFSSAVEGKSSHMQLVGTENIKSARLALQHFGVRVTAEEVGAAGGYKIFFESHTGKVYCNSLRRKNSPSLFAGR